MSAAGFSQDCAFSPADYTATLPNVTVTDPDLAVGAVLTSKTFTLLSTPRCTIKGSRPEYIWYRNWGMHRYNPYQTAIPGVGLMISWEAESGVIRGHPWNDNPEGLSSGSPSAPGSGPWSNSVTLSLVVTSRAYRDNDGTLTLPATANASHTNIQYASMGGDRGKVNIRHRRISIGSSTITFRTQQTCTLADVAPVIRKASATEFIGSDRVYADEFRVKKSCGAGLARPITYTVTDALSPSATGTVLSKSPSDPETGVRLMLVRPGLSVVELGKPWTANTTDGDLVLRVDYQKTRAAPPTAGSINSRATIRLDYP